MARARSAVAGVASLALMLSCYSGEGLAAPAKRPNVFRKASTVQEPRQEYALMIDKSAKVIYLTRGESAGNRVLAQYPVAIGWAGDDQKAAEGDGRTPTGPYTIDEILSTDMADKYFSPHLVDLNGSTQGAYGDRVFCLDYPTAADRAAGRSGSNIWIHVASPERLEKGNATNGCIGVGQEAIRALEAVVDIGVKVYISPHVSMERH
ncbi:MAG: L,D-transpeptidase [Nanoarchaeota archaeon]